MPGIEPMSMNIFVNVGARVYLSSFLKLYFFPLSDFQAGHRAGGERAVAGGAEEVRVVLGEDLAAGVGLARSRYQDLGLAPGQGEIRRTFRGELQPDVEPDRARVRVRHPQLPVPGVDLSGRLPAPRPLLRRRRRLLAHLRNPLRHR